ncbi:MAG: hypothetical protein IID16_09785 [Candidatus Marinimicrobia bacterium]|nr:hypothetical protein [Candidatus Neomarinimicrobiota bacterium]
MSVCRLSAACLPPVCRSTSAGRKHQHRQEAPAQAGSTSAGRKRQHRQGASHDKR